MHESTFQYLKPTDKQMLDMAALRLEFAELCKTIEEIVPDGEDRKHAIRLLRASGMWCNIAITRSDDGAPRS